MTRSGSRVLRTTGTTLRKTLFGAMATFLVLSATSTVATASHDLSVHGAGVDDNTVYQGQLFTMSATVTNVGSGPSTDTPLRYYRSDDTTLTGDDREMGTDIVPALSPSASSAESITMSIRGSESTPTGLRFLIGDFWLLACVDASGGGSSASNDCSNAVQINVRQLGIDGSELVFTDLDVTDFSPTVGQTITISTSIRNQGVSPSPETTLRYYRSTDSTIASTDTEIGSDFIAALASGQTVTQSITTSFPEAGTLWVGACFFNSCTDGLPITVEPDIEPDLTITGFAVASASEKTDSLVAEEPLSLEATVVNKGFLASSATEMRYYRSTDQTISATDTLLAAGPIPGLENGETTTVTATIDTPDTYWLGACVVAPSGEIVRSNNCSSGLQTTIEINDTTDPSIAITAPADGDVLSQLATIAGTSADGEAGIDRVELRISGGGLAVRGAGGQLEAGDPVWVRAATSDDWKTWSYVAPAWFNDTVYTIEARATDASVFGGNQRTASQSFHYFNGNRRFTTLGLAPSTSSILFGGALDASMKLTDPADFAADLAGSEILLDVTDPNGGTQTIGPFATNANGQVTVTGLGAAGNELLGPGQDLAFEKKGTWTLRARFASTFRLAGSTSDLEILLVGTSAGYAVIVQGRIANNEGLASHNKTANRIYRTFLDRGFADQNILYFNHDPTQDANQDGFADDALNQNGIGVDFAPTKAGVRGAIKGLAALVNINPAPIYVVFVDHGAPAPEFLLGNGETITPAQLDAWLDTLEAGLNTEAAKEPRVVVVGTCYSGGFIPQLSGPNRLIVASAAADEESYKGPREADGIRVGE